MTQVIETTKRCKDWCGTPDPGAYRGQLRWCTGECRDNRRRMHEGDGRKHGSQLVDEDDAINNPDLAEAAKKAMDTPLVRDCENALYEIARKHGLDACDEGDAYDRCTFPRCLIAGCEAEPAAPAPADTQEMNEGEAAAPYYLIERNDLSRAAWWGKDGCGRWTVDVHSAQRYATAAEAERECSAITGRLGPRLRVTEHLDMPAAPALAVEGEPPAEPTYPCEQCGKPRTKAEGGTTFTVCDACWEKHHGKAKPATEPPEMPFAEAMALPPEQVDVMGNDGRWINLAEFSREHDNVSLTFMRSTRYRRKPAPALTRVQRMVAERFPGTDPASDTEREIVAGRYAEAIRAVCEWLRANPLPGVSTCRAAGIEREFLGPVEGSR